MIQNKDGIWHREKHSGDINSIKDCKRNYKDLVIGSNDVVLDLGSNIGAFTKLYCANVKKVVAIEPLSSNIEVLNLNIAEMENAELLQGAIVSNNFAPGEKVKLRITNSSMSSISAKIIEENKSMRKNQTYEEVDTFRISDIIVIYHPTIIKIDIEGAEYGIVENIPRSVKQMSGELHGNTKDTASKMFDTWNRLKSEWNVVFYEEVKIYGIPALINFTLNR